MNGDRIFFDTNVLVYVFDGHASVKQKRAQSLLAEHGSSSVISTQVLQEFFVAATRKLRTPLSIEQAEAQVRDLAELDVVVVDAARIHSAIGLVRDHQLSFWDALIVAAAQSRGCRQLLSEGLQAGREFGRLRIVNPFVDLG